MSVKTSDMYTFIMRIYIICSRYLAQKLYYRGGLQALELARKHEIQWNNLTLNPKQLFDFGRPFLTLRTNVGYSNNITCRSLSFYLKLQQIMPALTARKHFHIFEEFGKKNHFIPMDLITLRMVKDISF